MKRWIVLAVIVSLVTPNMVFAENVSQVSRYLTVSTKPKLAQQDLLSQTIKVRFPENTQNIGEAILYVLRYSGYSLINKNKMNSAFKIMLSKPLPIIDRNFGPMSLRDALSTLSGPAFNTLTDPVNREINFVLKKDYQKYLKTN